MKLNAMEIKKLSAIKNSFFEDFKIEFLYHSNHLEGSTFSKENLEKLLFEKKVEGEHYFDDVIETRNSLNVFDMLIKNCDSQLDKFLLFALHRELKKGSVDEEIHNTGCWKKYENRLRNIDLKLALPSEVDSLMFNLLMDWKELSKPTIEDIATFHYKFEKIHPFQDGNGRIGRFIILKQCIEADIDLIAIDNEYEKEYKKALYKAQKYNDISELVEVFKKCQNRFDEKMESYQSLIDLVKTELD
jgi:Fic family protein